MWGGGEQGDGGSEGRNHVSLTSSRTIEARSGSSIRLHTDLEPYGEKSTERNLFGGGGGGEIEARGKKDWNFLSTYLFLP